MTYVSFGLLTLLVASISATGVEDEGVLERCDQSSTPNIDVFISLPKYMKSGDAIGFLAIVVSHNFIITSHLPKYSGCLIAHGIM